MRPAIAIDYDRTLTDETFVVREDVRDYLKKARENTKIIIASGREFGFFESNDLLDLGDALVLENGAVLYFLKKKTITQNKYFDKITGLLSENGVPFSSGEVVISFKRIYDAKMRGVLENLDVDLEYNRDSVMILPRGVNKGSGVAKAKELLGADFLACIGDAENDLSIYEAADYKGAVANAIYELKKHADYICKSPYGKGVVEFLDFLNRNNLIRVM